MKRIFFFLSVCFTTALPLLPAQAISYNTALNTAANSAGVTTTRTPLEIIGLLINVGLGLLGVILLLLTIYAGFLWMTAQGNEEQVGKAKTMIRNAIIGLIITLAAYSIATFVTTNISASTTDTAVPTTTSP